MRPRKWTKEQLIIAVQNSRSIRQVLSCLGLREAGGNYAQVKKYIAEYGVDSSPILGKSWCKGLKREGFVRIPIESVLVEDSSFQSYKLKNRLFKAGLKKQMCEDCGWAQISSDGRLPLEVHHKNGNGRDNRIENLQILCPNCHSMKLNYRGRNIK